MADFLIFEGISKSFGEHRVLNNVSLAIDRGEIFSLLGPAAVEKQHCCVFAPVLKCPIQGG
jgi:ABC-type lipopolysaccharide export system ATPase subunit